MRCLTLADALRHRGAATRILSRAHPGHLIDLVRQRSFDVTALPMGSQAISGTGDAEDYGAWLGATPDEDADQTRRALKGEHVDWLIVDHYGLDARWETSLRSCAAKLMVIDDLANRPHDCDALLDQNYADHPEARYEGLVSHQAVWMLGPRHALLRPEYLRYRWLERRRDGRVQRVLVFFGGSDPGDMTGMMFEALSMPQFAHLELHLVVGANYAHRERLERAASTRPGTYIHPPRPHLADLMWEADIAIGAGGSTTWERMCVGVPSIVISIARNQEPACRALADAGAILYLGSGEKVGKADLIRALQQCQSHPEFLVDFSVRSQLMVDGFGTLRVCEYLDPTPADAIQLRPATANDKVLFFAWANDPEVRKQAIQTSSIPWAQHDAWFDGRLASPDSQLFVATAGDLPVGQIRFDRDGDELRIDYSVDRLFRGRRWARRIVALGMARACMSDARVFRAEVKEANRRSAAVFRGLGFEARPERATRGLEVFVFDPSRQPLPMMS